MIAVKINVKKVDKARLVPGKENASLYLDLVLFENKNGPDKYGNNGFVTQSLSKEERQAGKKTPILGNWKFLGQKTQGQPASTPAEPQPPKEEDDVPF